jgi:hypothetical protein
LTVNVAAYTECCAQDLKHGPSQFLRQTLEPHSSGNLNDLVERNGLIVLDVLLLFSVSWRFLERFDDKGRSGWDDGDGGLTILDGELNGDTETFLWNKSAYLKRRVLKTQIRHTQSTVAFAISSPTFLGDRPSGPILGARADEAPTSPPVALRWLRKQVSLICDLGDLESPIEA